jgi:hypothetical protein
MLMEELAGAASGSGTGTGTAGHSHTQTSLPSFIIPSEAPQSVLSDERTMAAGINTNESSTSASSLLSIDNMVDHVDVGVDVGNVALLLATPPRGVAINLPAHGPTHSHDASTDNASREGAKRVIATTEELFTTTTTTGGGGGGGGGGASIAASLSKNSMWSAYNSGNSSIAIATDLNTVINTSLSSSLWSDGDGGTSRARAGVSIDMITSARKRKQISSRMAPRIEQGAIPSFWFVHAVTLP